MSSNIEVLRICEYCGSDFIARTTTTRYCSKKCNSAAFKQKRREEKIKGSNTSVKQQKEKQAMQYTISLKEKDILTVPDAAIYLSVCKKTIYNWLNNGSIKGLRMSPRKVYILKSDITKLLEQNEAYEKPTPRERKPITQFYTIKEVIEKFDIGETRLYQLIKKEKFPKTRIGGKTHLSKKHIDNYFKKKRDEISNIKEWYTVPEIQEKFNLTRDQIYGRVSENRIPKKKEGKFVKISKHHFDDLFIIRR